jgi:hypothetical protein
MEEETSEPANSGTLQLDHRSSDEGSGNESCGIVVIAGMKSRVNMETRDIIDYLRRTPEYGAGLYSENELNALLCQIIVRAPCNLLIFGGGDDSSGWITANNAGKTFIVDDADLRLEPSTVQCPGSEVIHVPYKARMCQWRFDLQDCRDHGGSSQLELALPDEVRQEKWDLIIVAGPRGGDNHSYRRQSSIYEASRLARAETLICVAKLDFLPDAMFCETLLDVRYLFFNVERLRIYYAPVTLQCGNSRSQGTPTPLQPVRIERGSEFGSANGATSIAQRTQILNQLIEAFGFSSYCEIGCGNGENFRKILCAEKTSVDPALDLYRDADPTFRMTSDQFFEQNCRQFDLIFIDGLHHADTCLRDIRNSLACISPQGMIVCHDVNPATELMQQVPRATRQWTGDCWKAWVQLRQESEAQMFVLDIETGLGVIYPAGSKKNRKLTITEQLTWATLCQNRREWLNLIPAESMFAELADGKGERSTIKPIAELTVVTLWRPGWCKAQENTLTWLLQEGFPSGTRFIWAVPEGGEGERVLSEAAMAVHNKRKDVTLELVTVPGDEVTTRYEKHELVADLYTDILMSVTTEFVLLIEDDHVPPFGGSASLRNTLDALPERTAAVMGAYRSRQRPDCACAADLRGQYLPWDSWNERAPVEVSWVGGGFTLYKTRNIWQCLPLRMTVSGSPSNPVIYGWDCNLSKALRQRGGALFIAPSIKVVHACPEVLAYCQTHGCEMV